MKRLLAVLFLFTMYSAAATGQVLLGADFDDKVVDAHIPTGGAVLGEPISVDSTITAIVRDSPFPTRALEIADGSTVSAGRARFEFLDGVEVSSDWLLIRMDVWLPDLDSGLNLAVRESGSSAYSFADVSFSNNGGVWGSDLAGGTGALGPYATSSSLPVLVVLKMDEGAWDLYVDGELLLYDRSHGVTGVGVGALLVGVEYDTDEIGTSWVDTIEVEQALFFDSFETEDTLAWTTAR